MNKKLIFIMFIILSFIKNVNAETFYGEYRKVENIGNYKEDEVFIENYKIYNTYKLEYIDLGYIENNELYLKDDNDFIEKNIYDLESDEVIEIITPTISTFQFLIYNLLKNTPINELEFFNKNLKVSYIIYNDNFLGNTIKNIKDGNYETIFLHKNDKEYVSIVLNKSYYLEDMKIILYTDKFIDTNIVLLVGENKVPITLTNNKKKKHIITFKYDKFIEQDKVIYKNNKILRLYKHYKKNIIKLNNYIKEGENIILDDYKDIENIYVRDKLILKNDLIINNKNTKVLDLIEYSTDDVYVNCDINYYVNNIYTCEFILNDIKVIKNIVVDIKKEVISNEETNLVDKPLIEEQESQIESIDLTSINENKETKKEIIQIKNNKRKENNKKTKNVNQIKDNKNINTSSKIVNTTKIIKNNNSKENVNNKNKKNIIDIVKYIIFINLIFIELILYVKKRNRNNVERV